MASLLSVGRYNNKLSKHVFAARSSMGVRSYSRAGASNSTAAGSSWVHHGLWPTGAFLLLGVAQRFDNYAWKYITNPEPEENKAMQTVYSHAHEASKDDLKMLQRDMDALKQHYIVLKREVDELKLKDINRDEEAAKAG